MVTKEDIEGFLNRLDGGGPSHSELEPGLWIVKPSGALDFDIVVSFEPPVLVISVKVMTVPADKKLEATLNRRLLELNATDLVHGAYGIEEDAISIAEALELAHLDYEEFQAAYESITVALASHLREIGTYREAR